MTKEFRKHIIVRNCEKQIKKGVLMINTSRGEIIDTNVLFEGIENGIIVGAGIDSFENEQEVIYTTLIGFVIQLLIELIKKK